ncbi:MAG TPA: CHRD domain-containing protein, partial [Pyrinomonadaceae bacterium]|nr:CHRD domain-containing protein [Pyrinomonadaceae bacterium]
TLTNEQYVDNLLASAGLSPSQVRLFVVNLTNSQEVPPTVPTTTGGVARPASFGTARFQFNDAQTAMTMNVTANNIDFTGSQTADTNDNLIAAHIHAGASVAPGVNGPVVWGFFGSPFNDNNPNDQVVTPFSSGVGGSIKGKWDAPEGNGTTLAAQLANLREGRAYINFHTTQFTGGEIRGNFPAADAFRNSLVAGLNGGTETRATVLRKVAEQEELQVRETNAAFVLMEYFGYLRRDADTAGFNFWLNKLNSFNGNFIDAEMVRAFIESSEYRQRFGP